jgi:predicted regulator of Ras-like GTPase activity (Roadblock/LC7/MglB family)
MIESVEIDDRIEKCERILEADPQSQIFAALADAFRKKGDVQKAYEICMQGLRIHPEYASARIVMAKIHLVKGNYDAAWGELEKAIANSGRTRAIDMLEAEILIRRGRKHEANIIIRNLLATDPDDENVKNLVSLMEDETIVGGKSDEDMTSLVALKPEKDRGRDLTLTNAISMLKVMPRVLGILAVGPDGLVLEGRFEGAIHKEEFAALSKGIFDAIKVASEKLHFGTGREVLIETTASKIWLFSAHKYLLVVHARDDVSIGALRLKIHDLFSDVVI